MTTLTSPHDLLAAIPFLIGYHPENSIVIVSIKDDSVGMAMRIDYPERFPEDSYSLLTSHLTREEADSALVVAYLPEGRSDGEIILKAIEISLSHVGIPMAESILVTQGRYRSIICSDIQCCPVEGREIPPINSSRIAAEAVAAGRPMPFINSDALTHSISPLALSYEASWITEVDSFSIDPESENLNSLQQDGASAVIDLAHQFALDDGYQSRELIARVLGRLSDVQVRDFALGSHSQESEEHYYQMWKYLLRIAPKNFIAPVGALCAAIAYERGEGALAHCALDRATEDDPTYSIAKLLRRVFDAGWPPEALDAMRQELHPKVCAAIFG